MPSGNYVVEGRVKDLINRGGEKISAEEVENLILAHPAVLNVACVPYPDPVLGERMCACLVLRPGHWLSLEELATFLLGFEIATFKLPERVLGFHFHPIMGHYAVDEPALNSLFETITGLGVPVMIDVGTTGMGAGLPGGLGARLEHARPLALDNLAARFPALTIIAAHPGWPWTDEMTAVALHKGNVYWELSGWAPKYFPPSLRTDIRGRLREKMMFGSDHPSLPYERILREWDELGYDQSVLDLVFHANAERVLGL